MLYGCNTNYIKIITEDDYSLKESKDSKEGKLQINIDELLLEKESIKLTNSNSIKKIAVLLCLLYTSDAADDSLRVDLGGRRIIKKRG